MAWLGNNGVHRPQLVERNHPGRLLRKNILVSCALSGCRYRLDKRRVPRQRCVLYQNGR